MCMTFKTEKQKNRHFKRRCGNKKAYPTIEAAKKAAWEFQESRKKKGDPIATFLRAYGCQCGKFHVGNSREINWDAVLNTKPLKGHS